MALYCRGRRDEGKIARASCYWSLMTPQDLSCLTYFCWLRSADLLWLSAPQWTLQIKTNVFDHFLSGHITGYSGKLGLGIFICPPPSSRVKYFPYYWWITLMFYTLILVPRGHSSKMCTEPPSVHPVHSRLISQTPSSSSLMIPLWSGSSRMEMR